MLRMIGEFSDAAVLSLRSGDVVGQVTGMIIAPDGLKILGFYIMPLREHDHKILLVSDIRQADPSGLIIDDYEKLADPADLIRLKDIIDIAYELIGKKVETDIGRKLGKVNDYAVDDLSWTVEKVYCSKGLLRDISSTGHIIDRKQIIEVTDSKLIVRDAVDKLSDRVWAPSTPQA